MDVHSLMWTTAQCDHHAVLITSTIELHTGEQEVMCQWKDAEGLHSATFGIYQLAQGIEQ